ncbi:MULTISPECIES: cytochrome c biogenesis protein CcsA [unclassified Mucilaginibacter]|uniref:cytochrome c biogenesis protein CcsA n=1 Tax=unclassified Mucilaginibacter TaxID=2617802 RepID=UPI0031F6D465
MYKSWWKVLGILLVLYSLIAGLLVPVPMKFIVNETIRNVFFHVPMWMAMFVLFGISVFYSIKYLANPKEEYDLVAVESINTGVFFYVLGLLSGMLWANYTWGEFWSNDPKQNSAAIAFLLYCAYLVLRNSIEEEQKRARVSAIYNIFAFPIMFVLLIILPRLTDSLHPGNGGNPAFGPDDTTNTMRMVLYPAFIGWILVSIWVATLRYRIRLIENKNNSL